MLSRHAIDIPEPSGLALAADGSLWSVSDRNGRLYRLSTDGDVLSVLATGAIDLEGITADGRDGSPWVVDESNNHLVHIGADGTEQRRVPISIDSADGSGLEGVAMDVESGNIFLLQEKDPARVIELDQDFEILNTWTASFARDVSGIASTKIGGELVATRHPLPDRPRSVSAPSPRVTA